MWLKALITTTCIAVLVAVGWYASREYELAQQRDLRERLRACVAEKLATVEGMTGEIAGLQCAFIVE